MNKASVCDFLTGVVGDGINCLTGSCLTGSPSSGREFDFYTVLLSVLRSKVRSNKRERVRMFGLSSTSSPITDEVLVRRAFVLFQATPLVPRTQESSGL